MYSFIKILITTIIILLTLLTVFIFLNRNNTYFIKQGQKENINFIAPEGIPNTHLEISTSAAVAIPLSLLNESRAAFFTYPVIINKEKHIVRFFVVKDVDSYRAVLDACTTCYTFNKGYNYVAPFFECRHCGMEFHWKRVGVSKGNCNPIKIGSLQEGLFLLVSKEDLENSTHFFPKELPK
ncbi:MAG: Fe-S-containing protein [Desulfovibrionaceae bacterium]